MRRYEALDAKAYAERVQCSLASAYRDFENFLARQSDRTVFRMKRRRVRIGSGAIRQRLVLLWPRDPSANDNAR